MKRHFLQSFFIFLSAGLGSPSLQASYLRTNNIQIPFTEQKALNLFTHRYKKDKCYLAKKVGVELTRAAKSLRGAASECHRFENDHWFVRDSSKETVFLVPFAQVKDIAFPFYYAKLAKQAKTPQPEVNWVQLYQNNIYRGVYLRVQTPFDETKNNQRVGDRRNLLFVDGREMVYVDTKWRERSNLYASYATQAKIFTVAELDPALRQLQVLKNTTQVDFVLDQKGFAHLYVTPLPLKSYYEKIVGQFKEKVQDDRLEQIQQQVNKASQATPLTKGLSEGYESYLAELKKMVEVQKYLEREKLNWSTYIADKTWSHNKVMGL